MTAAEAYLAICHAYLPDLPLTQYELREWWGSEEEARRSYELSENQEGELLQLCRTMIWQLPEGEPPQKPQLRRGQIGQRQGSPAQTRRAQPKRRYG